MTQSFVDPVHLEALRGSVLFYPCAFEDWDEPIALFAPAIKDFHFVDNTYFTNNSAENAKPVIQRPEVKLDRVDMDGPAMAKAEQRVDESGRSYPYLEPCTRSEFYTFEATGDSITVHRRRGYGEKSILRVPEIGIFFYRGDSPGESGSGVRWLSKRLLRDDVLPRLRDGGLIVTDGSMSSLKQLKEFHRSSISSDEAFSLAQPFERWQRRWTPVGWANPRYGPTLIWRLTKT